MVLKDLIAGLAYRAKMDVTVEASGKIEPRRRHFVSAKASGRVVNVHVSRWDKIEVGQVIAQLDTAEISAKMGKLTRDLKANAVRQARVRKEIHRDRVFLESKCQCAVKAEKAAEIQVDQVEREYRLNYVLTPFKLRAVPVNALHAVRFKQDVLEKARAAVVDVKSRLEMAALRSSEIVQLKEEAKRLEQDRFLLAHRLNMTSIRSAEGGTILTRRPEELIGHRVESGDPVVEISVVDRWQARVGVKEMDIPRVKRGQEVRVAVDAFPYLELKTLTGKVLDCPVRADNSRTYPVTVAVNSTKITDGVGNYRLAYGMGVTAKIVVDRRRVIDLLRGRLSRKAGRGDRCRMGIRREGAVP